MLRNKPFFRDSAIIVVVCFLAVTGCSGSDENAVKADKFDTIENTTDVSADKSEIEYGLSEEETQDQTEKDIANFGAVTDEDASDSSSVSEVDSNFECEISENVSVASRGISKMPIHYISGEVKFNIRDGIDNDKILKYNKPISGEFNTLTLVDSPPELFIFPFISGYSLELIDEYGGLVYKIPVRVWGVNNSWPAVNLQWPSDKLPFDTWIIDPPEFNSYALYNQGKLLAFVELSEHFPKVEVIKPEACKIIDESEFEVSWAGSDKDGDALIYSVEYSSFDEQIGYWVTFKMEESLKDTNLSIKRTEVYYPTSSQSRIRVIASDGTRSSYAESEIFIVSNAPSVAIDSYEEGETYETTEFILSAWATGFAHSTFDEPNSFADLNFRWHSNINGFLGSGQQIPATLPSGNHTITVTVSDRHGNLASDTIEFKVRNELS